MLSRVEYEQSLQQLTKPEWRDAVKQVNNHLVRKAVFLKQSDLNKWIQAKHKNTPPTQGKILGSSTYKKFIIDRLYANNKQQIDSPTNRKNAIRYLLLFYDEHRVWLACEQGAVVRTEQLGSVIRSKTGEDVRVDTVRFKPLGPDHDDSVVYDVFYWRTTRDDVGIAKLRFYDDWQKADLIYHYLTIRNGKEYALLTGDVQRHGKNAYISFADAHVAKGLPSIHSFWSLSIPDETNERDYIAGVFASSNRHNEPVCGKLILKQNESNPNLSRSDYVGPPAPGGVEKVLKNIPNTIFYSIANARLKIADKPIASERAIPHRQEAIQLKNFAGTYQMYQPWHNAELNVKQLVVSANGRVMLIGGNEETAGFVDYCDKTMIVKFAYDPDAGYYRFYFMLEKVPGSRNLTGIYSGLTKGQTLISGRLYLGWQDAETIQMDNLCAPARPYFDDLAGTDPDAFAFLTNRSLRTTDNSWTSHLDSLFGEAPKPKTTPTPDYLTGTYNAFFLTKIESDPRRSDPDNRVPLPDQPIQLIQMPLVINGDRVVITDGDLTVDGEICYDGANGLMMSFRESRFWSSLILSIPKPGTSQTRANVYHFGILARMAEEPEASAFILHREEDPARLVYRCFESFSELMLIEHHYHGLVSFLFGDWARFVRMNGYEKYTDDGFSIKHATFRQAFFAAACHYGSRNETTLCLDNLKRAFRQGFGQYIYARMDSTHADFPPELRQERTMLRDALDVTLTHETVKRYVHTYWKLSQYP
ncbi:hypothetical protein [Spirosoma arcticum]